MHSPDRLRTFATAILLLIPVAACSSGTEVAPTKWSGALTPVGGGTITGTVGAVSSAGRTEITVQIRKATPGATYGWRIDTGTCSGSGEIQGGAAQYPVLTPDPAGTASADAGIASLFSSGSQYAARVFAADGGSEDIVACGELRQDG